MHSAFAFFGWQRQGQVVRSYKIGLVGIWRLSVDEQLALCLPFFDIHRRLVSLCWNHYPICSSHLSLLRLEGLYAALAAKEFEKSIRGLNTCGSR